MAYLSVSYNSHNKYILFP